MENKLTPDHENDNYKSRVYNPSWYPPRQLIWESNHSRQHLVFSPGRAIEKRSCIRDSLKRRRKLTRYRRGMSWAPLALHYPFVCGVAAWPCGYRSITVAPSLMPWLERTVSATLIASCKLARQSRSTPLQRNTWQAFTTRGAARRFAGRGELQSLVSGLPHTVFSYHIKPRKIDSLKPHTARFVPDLPCSLAVLVR